MCLGEGAVNLPDPMSNMLVPNFGSGPTNMMDVMVEVFIERTAWERERVGGDEGA